MKQRYLIATPQLHAPQKLNIKENTMDTTNTQAVGYKAKAFEARNLVFYFLLAFGLSWLSDALILFGVWQPPSSIGEQFGTIPGILQIVLGFGPTIAAFIMTGLTEGKAGAKALWKRFWNRNMSFRWLLVTLLFLPGLRLVINLVARMLDGQAYPLLDFADQPWMIIPVIPQFLVAFIFNGMSEEFGWRGYALPRFQARWNALTSSLILGVIWASWHILGFITPGATLYQRNFWEWAPWIIMTSIFYTWIFNNTKGSVLAVALFHAMANTQIFWCCGSSIWSLYGVYLLAAVLIVIVFNPKNLVKGRSEVGAEQETIRTDTNFIVEETKL